MMERRPAEKRIARMRYNKTSGDGQWFDMGLNSHCEEFK